jgi:hypothetical protein
MGKFFLLRCRFFSFCDFAIADFLSPITPDLIPFVAWELIPSTLHPRMQAIAWQEFCVGHLLRQYCHVSQLWRIQPWVVGACLRSLDLGAKTDLVLYWCAISCAFREWEHLWKEQGNREIYSFRTASRYIARDLKSAFMGKRKYLKARQIDGGSVNYPFPGVREDRFNARTQERMCAGGAEYSYRSWQSPPDIKRPEDEGTWNKTSDQLKDLAKRMGISTTGKKSVLRKRIQAEQDRRRWLANDPPAHMVERPDLQGRVVSSYVEVRSPSRNIKYTDRRGSSAGGTYRDVSSQYGRHRPPSLGAEIKEEKRKMPDLTQFQCQRINL